MKSQIMKTAHTEARRRFGLCKTGKAYALFFAEELKSVWSNSRFVGIVVIEPARVWA